MSAAIPFSGEPSNRSQIRDGARQLGLSRIAPIGESVLSAESTTKAWQLRDRASDRESFSLTLPTTGT